MNRRCARHLPLFVSEPRWRGATRRLFGAALLLPVLLFAAGRAIAADANSEADAETITSGEQFWLLSGTAGDRVYPIRTEIDILYYDPEWKIMWADWNGARCFLSPGNNPLPLISGQRIAIDGYARPGRQAIEWDRTKVTARDVPRPRPQPLPDPLLSVDPLHQHLVVAGGLVSDQAEIDGTHLRLSLVGHDWTAAVYVRLQTNQPVPQWQGANIRATGVLSVIHDRLKTSRVIEIWVVGPEDIAVDAWLSEDERFALPRTMSESLPAAPADTLVRVEGVLRAHDPGRALTVWDESGQITVLTRQPAPVAIGERLEAIGYPKVHGVQRHLQRAVARPSRNLGSPLFAAGPGRALLSKLRLTEQIRTLAPTEASQGFPCEIRGVVTWVEPSGRSFFVQDASGGVRAALPDDDSVPAPEFSTGVTIVGATETGDFAPLLRVHRIEPGPVQTLPIPQPITFEQAMTGASFGEWVTLRGYVRAVTRETNELRRIDLTTPRGELVAHVRGLREDPDLTGALIDLRAVCDVVVNDRHQLESIQLWVPAAEFVDVREKPPADLFATPHRPIGSLLQFGSASQLHHRVRLAGVVSLHRPGEFLYLEDGDDRLLVLSRQTTPLQPGDRVEVVGFPGHEGARLIMRNAVYRRSSSGPPPQPRDLDTVDSPQRALDGATVRIQGRLLDVTAAPDGTRLQLQAGRTMFETTWSGKLPSQPAVGSQVEVIGVYRVQFDEYRHPRAFSIALRAPDELRVLQRPPWWTAKRVLWAGTALLLIVAVATSWAVCVSRQNRRLHHAERALQLANSDLETRVSARTCELELEIAERQHSEEALAQERKLLRTLIDSLPVYLYVKNSAGGFVLDNLLHAQLLGADAQAAVVGKTDFDIYPAEVAQRCQQDDHRVLKGGESLISREEPTVIRGEPRWLSTTKIPLRNQRGEIVGLIGIAQDITERKQAEAERETLNRQLLESSRRAGMAEVATGILHNVGNVLNSVNVSTTLVLDQVRESKVANLARIGAMLQERAGDLVAFLTSDPKGQKLPAYVAALAEQLAIERQAMTQELEHLRKNIEHIKDIVARQQSYAKICGVTENVSLAEIVEDALRLNSGALARYDVQVVRDYAAEPVLPIERHKVLQILVNLIRNAKYACNEAARPDKAVTLRIEADETHARIAVIDNGVGIPPENLTRIFAHGFTTRKDGHGFGLHSGSLAARELGGNLTVSSAGAGSGATFVLELPLRSGAAG